MLLPAVALSAFFATNLTIGANSRPGKSTAATLSAGHKEPTSPLAMAVQLEKLLAQGTGVLMPFPERVVKQDGGIIPLDATQTAFPPAFLAALVPETIDSVTFWCATLRVDDDSGNVFFYNADNEPFWLIGADPAIYQPDWVAWHCSPVPDTAKFLSFFANRDIRQERSSHNLADLTLAEKRALLRYKADWTAARQYLRPSHVELTFTNLMEHMLGTNPLMADSDGDGLSDGAEASFIDPNAPFRWFDVTGGTDLTLLLSDFDDGCADASLPFPVTIDSVTFSNLSVNANGLAGFYAGQGSLGSGNWNNNDLQWFGTLPSGCGLMVAGFWDDLRVYPAQLGSAITLADVYANNSRYCVLEYKNMGFYSGGATTNNLVSFQIVFEEGVSNRIWLTYQTMSGYGDGRSATLGAITTRQHLQFSYNTVAVSDSLALSCNFGTGTDPLNRDTDGDGLTDGEEIALQITYPGLDPLKWDTDGDMLPDGWELEHNLNPVVADNAASLSWDADNDGLGLFDEYRYCTDPNNPDTDGDGVLDGAEVPQSPGSCPNDSDDCGDPTNCITLKLTVGDSSGSYSERWNLEVFEEATGKPVARHCDNGFGTPGSAEYALVKGKSYLFKLRWIATDPNYTGTPNPDYDWQCRISFYAGRNTGREAVIRGGATESNFKLEVQIGDMPASSRPYIHGRVLQPKTVPIHAYIICSSNGVPAVATSTINGWIAEANRIYRQVAMTFTLASITTVANHPDWFDIRDNDEFYQMTSYTNNTGGLELYCVNFIIRDSINGSHSDRQIPYGNASRGMAVKADAPLRTLAHELGHACGLPDLYTYGAVAGLVSEDKVSPLNWSGGEGTGYYQPGLLYRDVMYRSLMHNHDGTDIPLDYLTGMDRGNPVTVSAGLNQMSTREPRH